MTGNLSIGVPGSGDLGFRDAIRQPPVAWAGIFFLTGIATAALAPGRSLDPQFVGGFIFAIALGVALARRQRLHWMRLGFAMAGIWFAYVIAADFIAERMMNAAWGLAPSSRDAAAELAKKYAAISSVYVVLVGATAGLIGAQLSAVAIRCSGGEFEGSHLYTRTALAGATLGAVGLLLWWWDNAFSGWTARFVLFCSWQMAVGMLLVMAMKRDQSRTISWRESVVRLGIAMPTGFVLFAAAVFALYGSLYSLENVLKVGRLDPVYNAIARPFVDTTVN